jgi:hypothetical protein
LSIFCLGILIPRKPLSAEKIGLDKSIVVLSLLVVVIAMSSLRTGKGDLIVLVLEAISSFRRGRFEKVDILELVKMLKGFVTVRLSKFNIKKRYNYVKD